MENKLVRNPAVDFTPMRNESVLFHPQTNQFCMLNISATYVWSLLEQPRTISELAEATCDRFEGVSVPQAVRDVEKTVNQLQSLSLVLSQA
jgi:hypothetical protein